MKHNSESDTTTRNKCLQAIEECDIDGKIIEYVDNYRFEFDGGQDYKPSETERVMLDDAIRGLLCDEMFMKALVRESKNMSVLASLPCACHKNDPNDE